MTEKKKITKDMTFEEVLKTNPEAGEILMQKGLHCLHCMMAQMETLEQGCKAHGMNEEDIDELIQVLNKKE